MAHTTASIAIWMRLEVILFAMHVTQDARSVVWIAS